MFKKATRKQAKIKLAVTGASGSGKTYSALRLAKGLADGKKVAVIDTENGSASLYSDRFDFDTLDLSPPFTHDKFISAISAAETAGYEVLVIDSASHIWEGILEYKSKLDGRGGNSYTNWADAGNKFKGILDAVLQSKLHVICCLRSKMDHVIDKDSSGRTTIKKVGMAPIMRDGIEYEFTTVLDVDMSHQASASKDRTGMFTDKIFQVTEDTGKMISQWLSTASAPEPEAPKPAATPLDVQIIEHPMAERFVSVLLGKLNKKYIADTTTKEQERILAYLNKQQEEAK
jgi:nucleoside-triphosphatase THEP1